MESALTFIGFGEAGMAFARAGARAFDCKTDDPNARDAKLDDFRQSGVMGCGDAAQALAGASAVLSLVTADQALAAARSCAVFLSPGALWFDMNSVAPDTKCAAAEAIEAAGGRYVDVAVMSPVESPRLAAPLLVSGPHAAIGAGTLAGLGFTNVRIVPGGVGAASSIKMIRSVMVKGIEALSAECALAAHVAGVEAEVIASLDASWPGADWARRFDYNLDRMLVHGSRRAAETQEAVKALDALGTGAAMTRGTVEWQRTLGSLGGIPPQGLRAKIDRILSERARRA